MNSNLKLLSFTDETRTKAPTTFIVGAQIYQAWFAQLSSSLPVTLAVENTRALKIHCQDLREQLRKMPMPAAIDIDLRRQLSAVCQQGQVSVRSLTTQEDKQGVVSTATNDVYLGVVGVDAVIARIIDCFVSMWNDNAVKNRSDNGGDPASISMVVVIKQMVDESRIQYRNLEECPDRSRQWV